MFPLYFNENLPPFSLGPFFSCNLHSHPRWPLSSTNMKRHRGRRACRRSRFRCHRTLESIFASVFRRESSREFASGTISVSSSFLIFFSMTNLSIATMSVAFSVFERFCDETLSSKRRRDGMNFWSFYCILN